MSVHWNNKWIMGRRCNQYCQEGLLHRQIGRSALRINQFETILGRVVQVAGWLLQRLGLLLNNHQNQSSTTNTTEISHVKLDQQLPPSILIRTGFPKGIYLNQDSKLNTPLIDIDIVMQLQQPNNQKINKSWETRYAIIYVYGFILWGNMISVIGPLIPLKAKAGGLLETNYSMVFTSRGIGGMVGCLLVAHFEKKYEAHSMIAMASAVIAVICFLNMSQASIFLNSVEWFITGLIGTFLEVLSQVSIVVIFKQNVNMWMQALSFGFGVGAFISPLMVSLIGNKAMLVIGVLAIINAVLIFRETSPKAQKQEAAAASTTTPEVKPEPPRILIIVLCIYLYTLIGSQLLYAGWIPSFCTITGVTNEQHAGISASIFWVAMTVGRLIAIPLANKFSGNTQLRFLSYLTFCVLGFCLLTIYTDHLNVTVYFGSALFGLAVSAIYPLLLTTPVQFGYNLSPENTAMFSIVGAVGESTLPVVIGFFIQLFGPYSLFITIFLLTCGMVTLYHIAMAYKPKQSPELASMQMKLMQH